MKKRTSTLNIVTIVSLVLLIILNLAITLAYFSDSGTYSGTIKFGTIKIQTNNNVWFSSTENYYSNVKPGDKILANNINFNLAEDSSAFYVRVKCEFSTESTNSEVLKIVDFMKNDWVLTLTSGDDYSWSAKTNNYYYLMKKDGSEPLSVSSVRTEDYTFLTTNNSMIPYELEYDGELVEADPIAIKISIEAIQSANIEPNISTIETELNSAITQ